VPPLKRTMSVITAHSLSHKAVSGLASRCLQDKNIDTDLSQLGFHRLFYVLSYERHRSFIRYLIGDTIVLEIHLNYFFLSSIILS
jgi:hypothetical protein